MRPQGDIRQALFTAAQQGPGTLRELAQRSQVSWQAARETVPRMARTGDLRVVDAKHVDYVNRLVHVYEAAPVAPDVDTSGFISVHAQAEGGDDPVFYQLDSVFRNWLD